MKLMNNIEFRSIATETSNDSQADTIEFSSLAWLLEVAEEVVSTSTEQE